MQISTVSSMQENLSSARVTYAREATECKSENAGTTAGICNHRYYSADDFNSESFSFPVQCYLT